MNPVYFLSKLISKGLLSALMLLSVICLYAQPTIDWQRSLGTEQGDESVQLFTAPDGNLIVIGSELHQDFTGQFRNYLVTFKLDPQGNEIWKKYHDIAFETFNPPLDYGIGAHFFTEEWGEKLINLVVGLGTRTMLVKLLDNTGDFFTYEDISATVIDVKPNNEKVYALTQCSYQISCYGPDSLIVQKFDPTPDSLIFNPIKWTYEVRQNIRTAAIQGHYDFDVQDIREDSLGNVYLLAQIERWDFQFCTDCGDAFIDAWCEVFKFSPQGQLIKHQRLVISRAVVSSMGFVSFNEGDMVLRVDDINAANTALVSTVYHVDQDLKINKTIKLNKQYVFIKADADKNLYACTNIYDHNDPEIHGEADVLVSKFNIDGVLQWKKYYGGSSWEWPRGFTLLGEDLVFLANTQSSDGNVEENLGEQDMWVVKLTEDATSVDPTIDAAELNVYPNPFNDEVRFGNAEEMESIEVLDQVGRKLMTVRLNAGTQNVNLSTLHPGNYILRGISGDKVLMAKVVKL